MWADQQHLDALSAMPGRAPHGGDRHAASARLLGTMAHVLGSEQVWLARFVGAPLDAYPDEADFADLAAVRAGFEELWPQMEFFLAGLHGEQLAMELAWISRGGNRYRRPLWQALVHMSHHSGYHRGQLTDHAAPARPPGAVDRPHWLVREP